MSNTDKERKSSILIGAIAITIVISLILLIFFPIPYVILGGLIIGIVMYKRAIYLEEKQISEKVKD